MDNNIKIKVSRGETINLGNFESLRCDISIEAVCDKKDVEQTYNKLKTWTINKIDRPNSFDEVIGNKQIVSSLESILKRDRNDIPHAFLLSGMSGCGKTTITRIIASMLGCPERINDNINSDFMEINAANFRGIDTAREIESSMHYKPLLSKVRVYNLDEVHMGTRDFQNSMLKPLEEAPNHVYFLLCTTEKNKIIKTIQNRCSCFEVQPLNDKESLELITWVLNDMEFNIPDDVKDEIVEVSEGCPRQILMSLDQILDLPEDQMLKSIQSININDTEIRELCQAMLNNDSWKNMAIILKGLKKYEPEKIRRSIIGYMATVILKNNNEKAALIFDCFRENVYDSGMPGIIFSTYNTTI
jgi:DNA polymerase III subunit gamma/tau